MQKKMLVKVIVGTENEGRRRAYRKAFTFYTFLVLLYLFYFSYIVKIFHLKNQQGLSSGYVYHFLFYTFIYIFKN